MAMGRRIAARRAVTAFFDARVTARQAVDDLVAAGVARGCITLIEGGDDPKVAGGAEGGLPATLKDLVMADEDRPAYGEGLRRGGVLVSVLVAGDEARIVEILDREGAVDMDARQSDWDRAGWDPTPAPVDLQGQPSPDSDAPPVSTLPADEIQAAIAPVGAVGPAFAAGEAGRAPRPGGGRALRDVEAEGLRLRTYVESQDASGRAG